MVERSERDQKIVQSYLDNIQAKTGKTVDDFRALATAKGPMKHGQIVKWLKDEFELGHGHASLIAHMVIGEGPMRASADKLETLFSGKKEHWRPVYEALLEKVKTFGPDVDTAPSGTYVSLVKGTKKFAMVQPSVSRLDIGIKLKGVEPSGRYEAAGSWNEMFTHRVKVSDASEIDDELLEWLWRGYEAA